MQGIHILYANLSKNIWVKPRPRREDVNTILTAAENDEYDIRGLAEAFGDGKLPNLQNLDPSGSNLGRSKSKWENLITAVLSTNGEISLDLLKTNVSEGIGELLKSLCTGAMASLNIGNEDTESVVDLARESAVDLAREFFNELTIAIDTCFTTSHKLTLWYFHLWTVTLEFVLIMNSQKKDKQ